MGIAFMFLRAIFAGASLGAICIGLGGYITLDIFSSFMFVPSVLLDAGLIEALKFGAVVGTIGGGLYLINRTMISAPGLSGFLAGQLSVVLVSFALQSKLGAGLTMYFEASTIIVGFFVALIYGMVIDMIMRHYEANSFVARFQMTSDW